MFYNLNMAQDLLEPELLYKRELKEKHHQNVVNLFDELVKQSQVDVESNKALCTKIYSKQEEAKKVESKLSSARGLKILFIIMIVLGAFLAFISIFTFMSNQVLAGVILLLVGIALLAGGIVLLVTIASKKTKQFSVILEKLNKEIESMIAEAYTQMNPLCSLFDEEMPSQLLQKTTPLIVMDRQFDNRKLEFLTSNYGYTYKDKDNCSKLAIQSGTILGNPFAFFKELEMNIVDYRYEGTLVITWTTMESTKNGMRTVHHTQTLHAYVTKPRPMYSIDTYLMYANDAAPNLTFSRRPSNINSFDEKGLEKYVRKHEGDLFKLAEKEMGKGGNYTPLGNSEFELFFGGLNRNNEVEYRLLFTPLAQKSMLALMKSDEGFGDDFSFVKKQKINFLTSSHSQGDALFCDVTKLYDFDFEKVQEKFIDFMDYYFKAIFFDLAPLLSIPLYQQHKAREYIYKGTIPSKFSDLDHECTANKYDPRIFADPETDTKVIVKTDYVKANGDCDLVKVTAHSFKEIKHVEIVPTLGGDGRMHGVPVTWYEYIPLQKESFINVGEIGGSQIQFNKLGNKDIIFNRGLVSYNQEQPLNIPIKELKEKMAKL